MSRLSAAAGFVLTLLLCVACWWLWSADHGLSRLVGLDAMDILVRVLSIFVLLSFVETVFSRLGRRPDH